MAGLLDVLSFRRSKVDSLAETFESAPEASNADASYLSGLTFNAPSRAEWLRKQVLVPEEDRVAELLDQELRRRGPRPPHAPEVDEQCLARLEQLAHEKEEAIRRFEAVKAESKRIEALDASLKEREDNLRAHEELVAERERRFEEAWAQQLDYARPEWLDQQDGTANVAVVGESGVGKSLLINTIRRVEAGSPDWAPVGVSETTMAATMYAFPNEPRVRLWDLPGAGTTAFPRERYLSTMGLRYFDAVLVVSAVRFTETEVALAKELDEHRVPRFMVRTKVDLDVWNDYKDNGAQEQATLSQIRLDLQRRGIDDAYLVSSREPDRYDLGRLFRAIFPSLNALDADTQGPSGWMDAWGLPEAHTMILAGVQGTWTNGLAKYLVHNLDVHITRPDGTSALAQIVEADGRLLWARCWYVDAEALAEAAKVGELVWKTDLRCVRKFSWRRP